MNWIAPNPVHNLLKAETTRPAVANLRAQQHRFDQFRHEFNCECPHEALDMPIPETRYHPSPREMPTKLPPLKYPDRFEVRYVSFNSRMRWNKGWVKVSLVQRRMSGHIRDL